MVRDPQSGVELLGDALSYADGAEDELDAIFVAGGDKSSASDELAARVHDWPTRYHLSRQRSNLLRPLRIRPGMQVLDVGAGTGAISRYLGEQGADVVALEGSLGRARAAAMRCEDLPNVRVVCGAVDDLDVEKPFELVVVVGVLEYSGHAFGGNQGPSAFLSSIRRLTAEDGAVALAIENQLGLKYLLGYAEDHLGEYWTGVEGYCVPGGIRTYSRRSLRRLLDAAGLPAQRWLYPYPDYKLPSVVLSERCFTEPDAGLLVDQLVRSPVVDHAHPRARFCDDRAAAASFVEAGLAEDVANSFLVLGGDPGAVGRLAEEEVLAWWFGGERLSLWLRTKKVVQRDGERVVETTPRTEQARQRAWLSQRVLPVERFVSGPTLEREALDALAQHDLKALATTLSAWHDYLLERATEVDGGGRSPTHPFVRVSTRRLLPDDHLDIELANFVRDEAGELHYVDREWCAVGGVDFDVVATRALWSFAHRLVVSGSDLPWSPVITVDELAVTMGALIGFTVTPNLLADWRTAEDALQSLVLGVEPEIGSQQRVADGQLSRATFPAVGRLPFTALRRTVVSLGSEVTRLGAMEEELASVRRDVAETATELADVQGRFDAATAALEAASSELARHRARTTAFERRLLVRAYRLVRRRPRPS